MPDGAPLASETAVFIEVSDALSGTYAADLVPWKGSPFAWILTLPSRTKGAVGEKLITQWLVRSGFQVTRPANSGCDIVVNGVNLEVKFSTLWKSGGYTFQQLRDQDYAFVFCLGISPKAVHAWLLPKQVAWDHGIPQHGGSKGLDTRWLTFQADNPPPWIRLYGGDLAQVRKRIEEAVA